MTPIVSIVIPCYNQGIYLANALQSIATIGNKDACEIIIVNDGSTDTVTLNILKELEAKGYHILHQTNKGLGAARNAGIRAAMCAYILPLDCDNKVTPVYSNEGIKLLDKDPALDVVFGNAEYFGEKTGIWESGEFSLQRLMIENYIDACAIFRKSAWERVGWYDEKMPVMGYEDWDLWLRIAFGGGKFAYLNEVCFYYRYTSTSMIHSVQKEKLTVIFEYMEKKHSAYLNRSYLNRLIAYKSLKHKGLAFNLTFRSYFPRISNLLRKVGLIKYKDIL